MYAKIKNGLLLQYPYEFGHLQADNPYTNFNGDDVFALFQNTEASIAGETLVSVVFAEPPVYDSHTQNAVRDTTPVLQDGQWTLGWTVTAKTAEELAQQDAQKASGVRAERNGKLASCDWTQLADSTADKAAWATYRQALRDVTIQAGFPWEIEWPESP